ncbi:MAG: hypothetical protein KJ720_04520 [Proteobacteria bacterium]|nr:hypothetical protein [Pseudomonadota bacterium]MBU1452120.1 hypothetical protein [Pseudomonadota bacterium]MBU2467515.1 hypothetical protein [Pseudomonadota bacterium]MBU2517920.1 hypothetical protein [Pseudomonadota bacterium]
MNATEIWVCVVIHGHPTYYLSGRQAVLSVLRRSGFGVFVVTDNLLKTGLRRSRRLMTHPLGSVEHQVRARRFLAKFTALEAFLEHTESEWVMLMDADAVLVRDLNAEDVRRALDGRGMGLVEQTTIINSTMNRTDFLKHYKEYSLAWLAPDAYPPSLEDFRFYNSGVVLATREEMKRFLAWAREMLANRPGDHRVGEHIIADQDYFQYYTNNLCPGSCQELPWYWNHCEHWDQGFPRPGAYVAHFSNFCLRPGWRQLLRIRAAWRQGVG